MALTGRTAKLPTQRAPVGPIECYDRAKLGGSPRDQLFNTINNGTAGIMPGMESEKRHRGYPHGLVSRVSLIMHLDIDLDVRNGSMH